METVSYQRNGKMQALMLPDQELMRLPVPANVLSKLHLMAP